RGVRRARERGPPSGSGSETKLALGAAGALARVSWRSSAALAGDGDALDADAGVALEPGAQPASRATAMSGVARRQRLPASNVIPLPRSGTVRMLDARRNDQTPGTEKAPKRMRGATPSPDVRTSNT